MNTYKKIAAVTVALANVVSVSTLFNGNHNIALSKNTSSKHLYKGKVTEVTTADGLLVKGKYAEAAKFYHEALNIDSQNIPAAVGLGMALEKQFKLDAAEEQFNKVLATDANNAAAHSGKAMVLLNRLQSSSNTVRRNRDAILKEAESEAQLALSADSKLPESHYAMGMVYKEQGRLTDAFSAFQNAVQTDSRFSDGHTGLGLIKLAQNNAGGAISDFKQALRVNSGDWTAHYGMGQALLKQGQVDAAIKELNTSLYQFPNSWPVQLALGNAYEAQGNSVAAVRAYQESIRIKPENVAAYLGVANIREVRGDIEHSIAELRSGLELMPDNAELRLRIGDESLRLEKLNDAISEYENVLSKNPRSSRAAEGLTNAYYLKAQKETTGGYFGDNDYDRAAQLINKAVQMNPNDLKLHLAQAKLRTLAGETVDASSMRAPQNDGERISYAQLSLMQNRFHDASEQMNQVIGRATDAKQALAIGDMSLMIHDLDSAETAYKKGSSFPGGSDRAGRGLTQVSKAREAAKQNLTLAGDFERKKMFASALDNYRAAIAANPRTSEAHLGLARTLATMPKSTAVQLRESAIQYRAYVSLMPNLPAKEQEKLIRKADKVDAQAYKLEQKSIASNQ